ncbi:hypothetical protein HDV05_004424 [Chytridiales sp. JEL 0842]|nr:hypothetical protein HDV05_004424 [Chytridiales sp. JEL 0842]
MDKENISESLKVALQSMITMDVDLMRSTIDAVYDSDCRLQNPYMILNGKEEIKRSYEALLASNVDLKLHIDTITYDADSQTAMVDMTQISLPKAFGGLVPLKIHQILKLQLEDSLINPAEHLVIAQHHEIHVAQDYLAQLPIVGRFYDNGLRSALGQITLAGSGLLSATGVLDLVPWAVKKVGSARTKAGEMVGAVVNASGVPTLMEAVGEVGGRWVSTAKEAVEWAAEGAKGTAAALIEEGRGVHVDCYSPTCKPGQVCYSPTCLRGKTLTTKLSVDNMQSIIRGMYLEGGKRAGILH